MKPGCRPAATLEWPALAFSPVSGFHGNVCLGMRGKQSGFAGGRCLRSLALASRSQGQGPPQRGGRPRFEARHAIFIKQRGFPPTS